MDGSFGLRAPAESLPKFSGNHAGLVVLYIASAEDEGDAAVTRSLGESIDGLRTARIGELHPVPPLECRPARRVVPEPFAELGARPDVSGPSVEPELLLRSAARPDAVHQDAVAVVRGGFVIGPLQADVAAGRNSHGTGPLLVGLEHLSDALVGVAIPIWFAAIV